MTTHQIFHHLLTGYISPHPGFGEHFSASDLDKLRRSIPLQVSGIGGHRMGAFLNYESVIKEPIFYTTFLRDPIARYMSSINWKKYVMKQDWTPESYGEETFYHNFQCFRICGERSFEKAKSIILNKFGFVGLMEAFNPSLMLLKDKLCLGNNDWRYTKENIQEYGEKKIRWEDLNPKTQAKYLENNKEDIRLYNFVKDELWPQYKSGYKGNLEADIVKFEESLKNFELPKTRFLKHKASNWLLGRVIQPLLFGQQKPVR
ncbi:MAG: hypothetical protein GYB31_13160 [Bacteroidetes bacterium]|nr:hypothetical protein [Bacteroidota bacterium]